MNDDLQEVSSLWATQIEDFEFDPRRQTCRIVLKAVFSDREELHSLVATEVSELRFAQAYTGPDLSLEASEVFVRRDAAGARLLIDFLPSDSGIEIAAGSFQLDGESL